MSDVRMVWCSRFTSLFVVISLAVCASLMLTPACFAEAALVLSLTKPVEASANSYKWTPEVGELLATGTKLSVGDSGNIQLVHLIRGQKATLKGGQTATIVQNGLDGVPKNPSVWGESTANLSANLDLDEHSMQTVGAVDPNSVGQVKGMAEANLPFDSQPEPGAPQCVGENGGPGLTDNYETPRDADKKIEKAISAPINGAAPPPPDNSSKPGGDALSGVSLELKKLSEPANLYLSIPTKLLPAEFNPKTDNFFNAYANKQPVKLTLYKVIGSWALFIADSRINSIPASISLQIPADSSTKDHIMHWRPNVDYSNNSILLALDLEISGCIGQAAFIWIDLVSRRQVNVSSGQKHLERILKKFLTPVSK
ncbi:MAG: hypothetical protein HQM09_01160 [Candidatus Riflebacteria bacterium]|nr:hypothetical protein [Candidatus Riflebacteria bacterium]